MDMDMLGEVGSGRCLGRGIVLLTTVVVRALLCWLKVRNTLCPLEELGSLYVILPRVAVGIEQNYPCKVFPGA